MRQAIVRFEFDDGGDPIAILACGHRQHVRHRPPMSERFWVLTEDGRRSKLGTLLDCVLCDPQETRR